MYVCTVSKKAIEEAGIEKSNILPTVAIALMIQLGIDKAEIELKIVDSDTPKAEAVDTETGKTIPIDLSRVRWVKPEIPSEKVQEFAEGKLPFSELVKEALTSTNPS